MGFVSIEIDYLIKKKLERFKYEKLKHETIDPRSKTEKDKPCSTCKYARLCVQDIEESQGNLNSRLCVQVDGHINRAVWQHDHRP